MLSKECVIIEEFSWGKFIIMGQEQSEYYVEASSK
jgi:hypothetical protein